jgi:glycosyl hydrolase family 114
MHRLLVLVALVVTLIGAAPAVAVTPPPTDTDLDYQLGGVRSAPAHVGIVVRDREARPVPGRYNVCYVNGFQTQPGERALWRRHPDLVLRDHGRPVVDEAWGEWLLDVRTATKRQRLAAIVGRWTRGCARAGFDAVEYDNLDSFTRSHGLLSRRQAVAYARLLVRAAHRAGLAAGQKNLAGLDGTSIGYDFAVAEECGRYHECGRYTAHFGARVLVVEYRRADFRWTCRHFGDRLAVVLRDRDLSPHGVRRWC